MSSWKSKSEFKHLNAQLASSTADECERVVHQLIGIVWPETDRSGVGWTTDHAGMDLFVWSDEKCLPLAVQVKGFRVQDDEFGPKQFEQCEKSVETYLTGPWRTKQYVFVHNKLLKESKYRDRLQGMMDDIVGAGKADVAEVWDRHTLLHRAFESLNQKFMNILRTAPLKLALKDGLPDVLPITPLESVPYRRWTLRTSLQRSKTSTNPQELVGDVPSVLGSPPECNYRVVLAEFGFGKTTALLQASAHSKLPMLYAPGAAVSSKVQGAKDLFFQLFDVRDVLAGLPERSYAVAEFMMRPLLERALAKEESGFILVIDGLDESAFLHWRGGMQKLFNILRQVRIPVVVALRTEFWHYKQSEFETAIGLLPDTHPHGHGVTAEVVELTAWRVSEISEYVKRSINAAERADVQEHLEQLLSLINTGEYDRVYGDIPKRPLFLRMIVDSVAVLGLPGEKEGPASLMMRWIDQKVSRDIAAPMRFSEEGRTHLVRRHEPAELVRRKVWQAMVTAAAAMTESMEGLLELTGACNWDRVLELCPALSDVDDVASLSLHSLLLPTKDASPVSGWRLRFAHRSFQEFLLACFIIKNPTTFASLRLPDEVNEWMKRVKEEKVLL